jgi:limonene-1,2-epoxide hydrolase
MSPLRQPAHEVPENADIVRSPEEIVTDFLNAMEEGDVEAAIALVADEIVYTNVSLPTIRGKDRFGRAARSYYRNHLGFEVVVHRIAGKGSSVLTERTDAITLGHFGCSSGSAVSSK